MSLAGAMMRSSTDGIPFGLHDMTSRSTKPTEGEHRLPVRIVSLGDALGPALKYLRQAMVTKAKSSGREFVSIEDLSQHMVVIQQALGHLSHWFEDLTKIVAGDENVGMPEAYRFAGRLEQVLTEFVDGYHEAMASHAGPEASEARELLLGVYRHHIREFCDWLEEFLQVVADPTSAIKKRGISQRKNPTLTVTLKMTSPPEMEKLFELAKRLQIEAAREGVPSPGYPSPQSSSPGILGTLGALAFGIGVTKAILGKHHD